MTIFAKMLIFLGMVFILGGVVLWLLSKTDLPIGKLPGDFFVKGKNYFVSFPIVSSLILSIFLTIVLNLIFYLLRKH